ncbi:efflux RND transporter periplasmic adaptor subunit [Marinicauda sp. Alg238-R41]|uniref:efflux RND transporter periplasmic adaptor subunit n=1 Tax=Marinicauda sp. Alg238-R41 TaxID=2993447 RepID=UPI0022E49428|nr:efflux RND transporter periplasmic adaptor subunit [Marinicauda sp. Alg238-R41]
MKRLGLAAIAFLALLLAVWAIFLRGGAGAPGGLEIETAQLERRDLSRIVSATGEIAPLVTVEVGSQLSGQILEITKDFNDTVAEGDLLARLDPQTYESRVNEARASLEVAQAQVEVNRAGVTRAQAELREAERAFNRAQELLARGTYAEAQFDTFESAYTSAQAGLAVARANLRNAQATLAQRQANLDNAEVDLERTSIRAPIDGIVIDRQIDVGQTVAASLNAPVLFIIAQDLSRIQIEAQVDEADIGQIATDQPVSFDVDAYPGRDFAGTVSQVRLAALNEQNVVTYTVVIEADNPGQRLLPGMTANVDIVTGAVTGVLAAPNAALRFAPRGAAEALVETGGASPDRAGSGGAMLDATVERLTEELELDEDQAGDVRRALEEAFAGLRQQMRAPGGPGAGRPDMQAMMQRALRDVLSADQMARFQQLQSERGARGGERPARGTLWVETAQGRLRNQPVLLGLSDGQYTQIMGDTLEAGSPVVVRVREAG